MPKSPRTLVAVTFCLLTAPPLMAQTTPDLTGHWEGSVQAPASDVAFAIDIARDGGRQLTGTMSLPAERIKGLPLLKVAVDGTTVTFYARADQPLTGTLSADGRTVTGDYFAGGMTMPFSMTRQGDARVEPRPTSAAVSADLAGVWAGVIAANGLEIHVQLTVANTGDGTATADLVNLDQGGLRLPLAVSQDGAAVTLTSTVVASGFSGTLNTTAGELAGTYTQGSASVPATFRRTTQR